MNKQTIKGSAKKAAGAVESAYGKATNDKSAQVKGTMKKVVGDAERGVGKIKDKIKDNL